MAVWGSIAGQTAFSIEVLNKTRSSLSADASHLCGIEGQVLHYVGYSLLLFALHCRAHSHCQCQGCPLLCPFAGAHKVSAMKAGYHEQISGFSKLL